MARTKTARARAGDHGPMSAEQAIAIDADARRAGIPIPEKHTGVDTTKNKARRDRAARAKKKPDPRRTRATTKDLKRRGTRTKRR